MATLSEITAQAKKRTVRVSLCLRGDLIAEHQRLEAELQASQKEDSRVEASIAGADSERTLELAEQVRALEDEMGACETSFKFEALGRTAWRKLMGEHPPSEADREGGSAFNPETFPSAAIAASLLEPSATVEEVEALGEILTNNQWDTLWGGCLEANVGARTPGESLAASVILQRSRPSSTTADHGVSLEAVS